MIKNRLAQYFVGLWRQSLHAFERGELTRTLVLALIAFGVSYLTALGVRLEAPHIGDLWEWTFGLWVIFLFVFIAPFRLWLAEKTRADELEETLKPKLRLEFDPCSRGCVHTTTLGGLTKALFVRVLPQCETSMTNCVGYLRGVFKLSNDKWEPTEFDERLDLTWANRGNANPITIQNGVPQYLDIFCIPSTNMIWPCFASNQVPNRAKDVFNATETFRIDVGVMGDGGAASLSLKVKLGDTWDTSKIELISKP
jgi:hypothetical protein